MKPTFVIAAAAAAAALLAGCCQKCGKGDACTAEACDSRNEVIETILTRRSIRAYSPEAVDRTQMQTIVDCGLLAENMMLAAWSMGIGSCCLGSAIGFIASTPETAPFIERLSLPEGYRPLIAIGFGYPDEQPEARERDMSKAMFVD